MLDAQGKTRFESGKFVAQPELEAPVAAAGAALVWHQRMLLRTRIPILDDGQRIGEVVLDEAVPDFEKILFDSARLGTTGEIVACFLKNGVIACFPGNRHTAPFMFAQHSLQGASPPVELAIGGRSDVTRALDYRGNNVVAAYAPLVPGLGFVAKQDATEVYGVIRSALATGTPIILMIALLGVVLLYSQLQPLATSMRASELVASEKELEMHTIMDAAGDGILTIDQRGRILSVNVAACRIFGQSASELTGASINSLMPADLCRAQMCSIAQRVRDGLVRQAGAPNLELIGRRTDGTAFPLELTVNQVPRQDPRPGQQLFVGVMRDISERKEVERRLSDLAQYDDLTGLPNRSLFMDRLDTALRRSGRSNAAFALMFLDLDGFKQINDTLGHEAGDAVLVQFAQRLCALVRKTGTVARLAGDEFTVVLEVLDQREIDARAVAEKIIASMQYPFVVAGCEVLVTVSIGVVLHDTDSAASPPDAADLLRRADHEMYAAKHAGKNAFRMA